MTVLLGFKCYSLSEYISLRSKRYRAVSEQRTGNESQRRRAKNAASKRAGRGLEETQNPFLGLSLLRN